MPEVTTSDGRTLSWTGLNICYCSKCEELFNSVAAFDKHLKRASKKGEKGGHARHDISGMPRNAQGRLVTALKEPEAVRKIAV